MSGSISSSTYYNVTNSKSSNTQLSGLMSGMETDEMVEKMLAGTQGKIDKQQALKEQATWKQEMYRDVISSINGFYDKYFNTSYGSTLKNNFAKDTFFDTMASTVKSGSAVNIISTSSGASVDNMSVVVKQLASTASLTSAKKMSTDQTITGNPLGSTDELTKLFDKSVTLTVGTDEVKVDLSGVTTQEDMVKAFNDKLAGKGVTVKIFEDRLRLVTDKDTTVAVKSTSSALGLKMTGLAANAASKATGNESNMLQGTQVQPDTGYTFDVTLDGVQKSITLNNIKSTAAGEINAEAIAAAVSEKVSQAFGNYVEVKLENNALKFSLGSTIAGKEGHELIITGADATKVGLVAGSSTLFSTGTKLNAVQGVSGDKFSFTINGVDFSFDGSTDVGNMINTINKSNAGVRISYSSISDTFKMESTSTGSQYGIDIQQKDGNILSALFGDTVINAGSTVNSKYLTTGGIQGTANAMDSYATTSASLKMKVNGTYYTFSLPVKTTKTSYTVAEIETNFNAWLEETFGAGNITYNAANNKLTTASGYLVQFDATTIDTENKEAYNAAKKTDLALAMGFNKTATSNIATADTDISAINNLNGLSLTSSNGKLSGITGISDGTNTYSTVFMDGRLVLSSDISGASDSFKTQMAELFGKNVTIGNGSLSATAVSAGKDALLSINGTDTTRSSNSFTIDGVTMEATHISTKDANGNYDSTVIATTRDIDTVTEGFKSFVEDYNAMLEKLNGYLGEDANYRKYSPLTTEQKKDMTDKEIELWEEKSKQGLLRNDDTISGFLSQMRTVLYTKPTGSTLALYNIGIDTTKQYNDKGKLQFDEAAFKQAFNADPNAVRTLFTSASDGLSSQLMATIKSVAERSSGSAGSLVRLAGIAGASSAKNNTISTQITSIEAKIKELKAKYEKERTRYWAQFTNMEKAMASYNKQSASLSSFTGG